MMGRGTESNGWVATTTSQVCRAVASASPTDASWVGEALPRGLSSAGSTVAFPEGSVGSRQVSLSLRFVDDLQVPGHISCGKDVRRARPKLTVHLYVPALVDLDSGGGDIELGGVGDPTDRENHEARVDRVASAVLGVGHSHSGPAVVEALDRSGVFKDVDARRAERGADSRRNVFVLAHQNPRGGLEQRHA